MPASVIEDVAIPVSQMLAEIRPFLRHSSLISLALRIACCPSLALMPF